MTNSSPVLYILPQALSDRSLKIISGSNMSEIFAFQMLVVQIHKNKKWGIDVLSAVADYQ
jgi:hypothetical protein